MKQLVQHPERMGSEGLEQRLEKPPCEQTTEPLNERANERSLRSLVTWRALLACEDAASQTEAALGPAQVELGAVLGRGGMGLVRSGYQRRLAREVAVKELLPERTSAPGARTAFLAEARITGHLDHPNIVPVYALEAVGEQIQIIMKRVRGRRWLDDIGNDVHGLFPMHKHLEVLLAVCNAVAFAHARGVVHRDIKPANVMLGRFGEVWLMDWGLALALEDAVARSLRIPHRRDVRVAEGTPAYMAPEMAGADGTPISYRTDVFLLGAVLYHLLAKAPPYAGADRIDTIERARCGLRPALPPETPTELVRMCERAMAQDPEQRHGSVQEFKAGIEAYLRHEQSTRLSHRAREELREVRARSQGERNESSRAETYAALFDVIGGFHRAVQLWPRNPEASEGLGEARLLLASEALEGGDFDLARTQLVGEGSEALQALRAEIDHRQAKTLRKRREAARFRGAFYVSTLVALVLVASGALSLHLARRAVEYERRRTHLALYTQLQHELRRIVAGSSQLMSERRRAVELIAAQYAREVREALLRPPPADVAEPVLSIDLPADRRLHYDAPSFFFPSSYAAAAPPVLARLTRAQDATHALHARQSALVARYFAGIEEGHVLMLYPGAGGVSPNFDPLRRPWYQEALRAGGVVHTPPYTDHTIRDTVISTVLPLHDEQGKLLGVAGVDTLLAARLAITALPKDLENFAEVLVVAPNEDSADLVRIVARREYSNRGSPDELWRFDVPLDQAALPGGRGGQQMRADLARGVAGVLETRWKGEQGTLAYAPIEGSDLVLCVFVEAEHIRRASAATAEELGKRLDAQIARLAGWAVAILGTLFVAVLVAAFSFRGTPSKQRGEVA
ncbi:MAG: protein kinase [Myxococcales bacterium]